MCVRKLPLQRSSTFLPGNGARKRTGAKLTWEYVVDVGAYSSLIPGNGARKRAAGAWVMAPEDSLCVVNDQPVGNPKRKV
jgi:hypothetical protein